MPSQSAFEYAWRNLVGTPVEVSLKDGQKLHGIFQFSADATRGILLQQLDVDTRSVHTNNVPLASILQIFAHAVTDQIASATTSSRGFTDSEIAQNASHLVGRELQKAGSHWMSGKTAVGGLEEGAQDRSGKKWDQFAANEKFGVKNTYKEELYTSKLDKSQMTKEQIDKADKLAREIEGDTTASSTHLLEERGIAIDDSGLTEEEKYSGVLRAGQGAYLPPHARKQQRQASETSTSSASSGFHAEETPASDATVRSNAAAPSGKSYAAAVRPSDKDAPPGGRREIWRNTVALNVSTSPEARKKQMVEFQQFKSEMGKKMGASSPTREGDHRDIDARDGDDDARDVSPPAAPVELQAAATDDKPTSIQEMLKRKHLDVASIPEFTPSAFAPAPAPAAPTPQHIPYQQQVYLPYQQYANPQMNFPIMMRPHPSGGSVPLYASPEAAAAMSPMMTPMIGSPYGAMVMVPGNPYQPQFMTAAGGPMMMSYGGGSPGSAGPRPVMAGPYLDHTTAPMTTATVTTFSMSPQGSTVSTRTHTQHATVPVAQVVPATIVRSEAPVTVTAAPPAAPTTTTPVHTQPPPKAGKPSWSAVASSSTAPVTSAPAARPHNAQPAAAPAAVPPVSPVPAVLTQVVRPTAPGPAKDAPRSAVAPTAPQTHQQPTAPGGRGGGASRGGRR